MTTAFITHNDWLLHEMGVRHPERPARLKAVEDQMIESGLIDYLQHVDAPLASRNAPKEPVTYQVSLCLLSRRSDFGPCYERRLTRVTNERGR